AGQEAGCGNGGEHGTVAEGGTFRDAGCRAGTGEANVAEPAGVHDWRSAAVAGDGRRHRVSAGSQTERLSGRMGTARRHGSGRQGAKDADRESAGLSHYVSRVIWSKEEAVQPDVGSVDVVFHGFAPRSV